MKEKYRLFSGTGTEVGEQELRYMFNISRDFNFWKNYFREIKKTNNNYHSVKPFMTTDIKSGKIVGYELQVSFTGQDKTYRTLKYLFDENKHFIKAVDKNGDLFMEKEEAFKHQVDMWIENKVLIAA